MTFVIFLPCYGKLIILPPFLIACEFLEKVKRTFQPKDIQVHFLNMCCWLRPLLARVASDQKHRVTWNTKMMHIDQQAGVVPENSRKTSVICLERDSLLNKTSEYTRRCTLVKGNTMSDR